MTREWIVMRRRTLIRIQIAQCIAAAAAAVLLATMILLWKPIFFPHAAAEPDPRLESACKFPRVEGAMTVIAMLDGKLICWRWQ